MAETPKKTSAPASCGPTLESALLKAEATPECWLETDVISARVSGVTSTLIPRPKRIVAGKTSIQELAGGSRLEGWAKSSRQGVVFCGRRLYQRTAAAIRSGPATRKGRGPNSVASRPMRD